MQNMQYFKMSSSETRIVIFVILRKNDFEVLQRNKRKLGCVSILIRPLLGHTYIRWNDMLAYTSIASVV